MISYLLSTSSLLFPSAECSFFQSNASEFTAECNNLRQISFSLWEHLVISYLSSEFNSVKVCSPKSEINVHDVFILDVVEGSINDILVDNFLLIRKN